MLIMRQSSFAFQTVEAIPFRTNPHTVSAVLVYTVNVCGEDGGCLMQLPVGAQEALHFSCLVCHGDMPGNITHP